MRYEFDGCEVDTDRVELRVDGEVRPIEPQVYEVLHFLLAHRDRVLTKEEILDGVWHHRFVTESALTSRIKSVRRAIGDDGRAQRLVRTVHGRGYQFIGEVTVHGEHAGAAGATSLPVPPTPTVGRDRDVNQVVDVLGRSRVVTLLGPGGVGKTRLATEAARRWQASTGHDAVFVDLTRTRDAQLVLSLIVQEMGIHDAVDVADVAVLKEALRERTLLLVLDNFEHVVDAALDLAELVGSAPDLRVLVTSRARLRVAGEQVVDVEPLGTAPAVALFDQVASSVDPSFDLAAHEGDVVAICRAVDGLPLAIELAAGHVRTLSPPLLRARLADRLGADEVATRDAPTRQRTITATIDWSLDLLAPADRALFAQMGIFSGPVSLEAIEATCRVEEGTVVDSLARLVDQSLVRRTSGVEGAPRFSLLELMRERARELLDEAGKTAAGGAEATAERHLDHVVAFLDDVAARRWTDLSHCWIDLVTEALGEVRAARAWAVDTGRDEAVVRIVGSLGAYWHREGHQVEGRGWVEDALARTAGLDAALVAHLDVAAGFVEWPRTQLGARTHWARAAGTYRDLGLRFELAYALALGAGTYIGDTEGYATAMAQCDEALTLARRTGNRPLIAQALNVVGELARVAGEDAVALAAYEEGLEHARAADDAAHSSVFVANLAYMASRRGEAAEARRLARDALRLCWSLGRRMMAAWTVAEIAGPELELGRPDRAAVLIGAGDEALRVVGGSRHPGDQPEYERVLQALRAALGDDELERRLAEGAAMTLEAAVRLALDEDAAG